MEPMFHVSVVAVATVLLLAGCGGTDSGKDVPDVEGEAVATAKLDFEEIETMTPETGFVGHENEARCQIVKWSENSTGITPEELRDKSTFFRQMDCYGDDSGFPELVQVGLYAEFSDEDSAAAYSDSSNGLGKKIIVNGSTVFMISADFDTDFTQSVRELCDCELIDE